MPKKSEIQMFYRGETRDNLGRHINDIWRFDFDQIEWTHDFIQWLFPLMEKSLFNSNSPILTQEDVLAFKNDPDLQKGILFSLDFILPFFGLRRRKNIIVRDECFDERSEEWHWEDSHHHLRLTRIIKSLDLFGHRLLAESLRSILLELADEADADRVSPATILIWDSAIK